MLLRIALGLVVGYGGLLLLACLAQERIAFPAPRAPLPDPQRVGFPSGERVDLKMNDGTPLVGWFLRGTDSARGRTPGVLWFYGNGETIAAIWPVLRDFRPPGAALLVLDYPGYGGSGGTATEAGLYEAGELAYAALAARPEVDPRRIVVYGRSLGSAVATYTAARHPVAGLVLESPFTSAREMSRQHYGIFPRSMLRLGLDNLTRIRDIHAPLLLFHGSADLLVPPAMGQTVAAAAPGPVEVVLIEGAGHNETYAVGGRRYAEKLAAFVMSVGRTP